MRQLTGLNLVAKQSHRLNGRADESYAAFLAHLGKMYVLGEESVARMNRLNVGNLGGAYDPRDVQIALGTFGRANTDGFIGQLQVWRIGVGLGLDYHRFDAKLMTGANDPQRYLTTISYQDS